jgi:hypothetical protein
MAGTVYTITCVCGRVHSITCPGGGLGAGESPGTPGEKPASGSSPIPFPRVPSGPIQGYYVSLVDALPPDFFSRGSRTGPLVVHLDVEPLLRRAAEAGRHVILSHGSTVIEANE